MSDHQFESPKHPVRWRGPLPKEKPRDTVVFWLVSLNVIAYVITNLLLTQQVGQDIVVNGVILQNLTVGEVLQTKYWLSASALMEGEWGRLITHMFLHGSDMHILANMLALYSFGRAVEDEGGSNKLLAVFFLGGIAGGLLQVFMSPAVPLVGASGGVFGVVLAFCWLRWEEKIHLLLVFVIPLKVRGRSLAYGLLGGSLLLGIAVKLGLVGSGILAQIGHWAHLGGGIVGFGLGYMWFRQRVVTRRTLLADRARQAMRDFPRN